MSERKSQKRIILASGSPRRKELLEQIGIEFEIITSQMEEVMTKTQPEDIVIELSTGKAQVVAEELCDPDAVVIGSDTIVYAQGQVLGKPVDYEDAKRMLSLLSGKTHHVYTGVTFIWNGQCHSFFEKTAVSVYPMSEEEMDAYIKTQEPMDKAGAYGIQGRFAAYVKGIEGDYNTVVGLPISRLYHELRKVELL